jgi:hypothetical protein
MARPRCHLEARQAGAILKKMIDADVTFPAGYVEQVEAAIKAIETWIEAFTGLPDLQFNVHPEIVHIGNLDERGRAFLGVTADARALLAELDRNSDGQLTLVQATCALELAGLLPAHQRKRPEPSAELDDELAELGADEVRELSISIGRHID